MARLLDMGIESYLLSTALNGAVAQRLARTICPHCETKYYPAEHVLKDAHIPDKTGKAFRKGAGCNVCHNSGFQGRMGIYEVMEVTPAVRRMIHHGAPSHELREKAQQEDGMLSLRQEGVKIALDGRSSLEEVLRVTASEDEVFDRLEEAERKSLGNPAPAEAPTEVSP